MHNIHFIADFGESKKEIQIDNAFGAGGNTLHLLIDRRYRGIFLKRDTGWAWLPQNVAKDNLSSDDISILIELIEGAKNSLAVEAPLLATVIG